MKIPAIRKTIWYSLSINLGLEEASNIEIKGPAKRVPIGAIAEETMRRIPKIVPCKFGGEHVCQNALFEALIMDRKARVIAYPIVQKIGENFIPIINGPHNPNSIADFIIKEI